MKKINPRIWLITDTHFGHHKMIEYCNRPKEFERKILTNLNQNIRSGDTLIHLGDICFGRDQYWHKEYFRVAGTKNWLLKGNHDRKSNSWYLSHGWDFVGRVIKDKFFGKKVVLSHAPVKNDGEFDFNIHGHFHNSLHRLQEGKFIVNGEKERNEVDLANLTRKHKLLAIEDTNYQPILLEKFIG